MAEAIGWLHDYRKCSDLIFRSGNFLDPSFLNREFPDLTNACLSVSSGFSSEKIEVLLNKWKRKHQDANTSILVRYISRCHNASHFDKQEPNGGEPNYPNVQLSTPFGFERGIPADLTTKLRALPWADLSQYSNSKRDAFQENVRNLFSRTIADTRRPVNEIDLWNWGVLVGALYKSALAGALLTGSIPSQDELRWRLLGVQLNGLDFFFSAARIPDLLSKQQLVLDGLNKVRNLLEVVYPLASEVYRDENGSIYVVPDLADLLNQIDSEDVTLDALILETFGKGTLFENERLQIGWEIKPDIKIENSAWWGQDPERRGPSHDELPDIGEFLARKLVPSPKAQKVADAWTIGEAKETCGVCGLRPQGPSSKAVDRAVCDICEQRRADRSKAWADDQAHKTIWTDEVADQNGRLALITGRFELMNWLDGSAVASLLLIPPDASLNRDGVSKDPSFSRLRRVWETTRRFWKESQTGLLKKITDDRRRLMLYLSDIPDLGSFHVYDLEVGSTTLNLVWVPPSEGGYFISADNLGYIARRLNAGKPVYESPETAAIFVEDYLKENFVDNRRQPVLLNPDDKSSKNVGNLLKGMQIQRVAYQEAAYAAAVPIFAEPRTFMALVPADKALDILNVIKTKYEREMGKVRNRLPLHLGAVYFHRRTPLRAALDAGRRMLDQKALGADRPWTVQRDPTEGPLPENKRNKQELTAGTNHFQKTITVKLKQNDRSLDWHIPAVMGDGETVDDWYPYIFLETNGDDSRIGNCNRFLEGKRPTANGLEDGWLVHAGDLEQGDQVYFTPATFDFEWLDTSARRFEIAYDENGKRHGRQTRPCLLDDLDAIDHVWEMLAGSKGLTNSQIHALRDVIESKRLEWRPPAQDETFRRFCRDAVKNADWGASPFGGEKGAELIAAAESGLLSDAVELHMEIMKQRSQRDKNNEEATT